MVLQDMKKYSKLIAKTLLFVILLSIFYIFYLNSQVKEFLKAGTTFTSRYEETEKMQVPNLLLCMKPGMKRSAIQRFGYLQDETYSRVSNKRVHLLSVFNWNLRVT